MQIECCICCEILSATEEVCATNCGHVFHDGCLKGWLFRSETCPHCRAPIQEKECMKLYIGNQQNGKECKMVTVEQLSEDEVKRLTELKATIKTAIGSMQRLHQEIENISLAKTTGKESMKLCANIRTKLLRDFGAVNGNDSSQVDLKNTEKKISDALGHIKVFEDKMFLTNKTLCDLANKLEISGSGDRNKYSAPSANDFSSGVRNNKKNFY